MKKEKDYKLFDEVIIKSTGEHAFIVWVDDEHEYDSFILEKKEDGEAPKFYHREDFELVK